MSNLLSEMRPELVSEWSDKNLPLTPDKITYGSNKVVWWKGACGHEWQTSVKARSSGENCPICSGARVIEGINDLATLKPELADEWSSKNNPLKPTMITIGSHKKVIWLDKYGHEWTATVKSRALNGTGCPYCNGRRAIPGETDCGNEWYTLISTRSGGSQCPYCSGYTLLKGFNDLATTQPKIAAEWSEKNEPLKADEVNEKSRQNVWWRCQTCGNEWKAVVNTRVKGAACPVCTDRAVLAGYNDLATTDRHLLAEWDFVKNTILPTEISRLSMKVVWWKCPFGHMWRAKISDRTLLKKGCIVCDKEYDRVFPALTVGYYASLKGLKVQLGSDKLLGITLEAYLPSEKLAIEWTSGTEQMEILKVHLCRQRQIKLIKLPYEKQEDKKEYADKVKAVLRRQHIFISTNTEQDIAVIQKRFMEWRKNR